MSPTAGVDHSSEAAASVGVFISYRRVDTGHPAGRLYDTLVHRLGERSVFMDVDSIGPGTNFHEEVDNAIAKADVIIVLMGEHWLQSDEHGHRRIDESDDLVRLEIERALERKVRIIPILVDNAIMPNRKDLPDTIGELASRQAIRLRHETFTTDVQRLMAEMGLPQKTKTAPGEDEPAERSPARASEHQQRFIAQVRERRTGRADRTQFELIPDEHGGRTLAAVTQLLIRAEAERDVRSLLEDVYALERREVAELDHRVVWWRGGESDSLDLSGPATELRRQGVRISANYCLMSMNGHGEGAASPKLAVGAAPVFPQTADEHGRKSSSPVRIVVIDTGVYGRDRSDGWLVDLETMENREDLDDLPPDGYLDLAAGQGTFCAGIVQQIVPNAHIVVSKRLDSDGLAHELRIARELVGQVREGLKAGQHVIVNLSFGTETVDDERPVALEVALEIIDEESRQAGLETVVVAAAGNFGHNRPCYPAAFPTVTAVAALTQEMLPAEWSSRGVWVDVCTIGESVRSTFVPGRVSPIIDYRTEEFPQDAWALWSGTSFAAPQVAGAIAKIAIEYDVTPTEAKRRLLAGATDVPLYGKQVEILPRTLRG